MGNEMTTTERIEQALKRIKELLMLVKYWTEGNKNTDVLAKELKDRKKELVKDLDGVVDFPTAISKKIKSPLRFYCRGDCASYGNLRRSKDWWGCMTLKDFLNNLQTGKTFYEKIFSE